MPLPNDPKPWSFYRLGPTNEKQLFKRHRDSYDGVVIPAHIASYYNKFCCEFVGSLGKPYLIDPMTYIFANDPAQLKRFVKDKETGRTKRDSHGRKKKGDVKRSFSKLVEQDYEGVVQVAVDSNRPVVPGDFTDDNVLRHFVQRALEFQTTRLAAIPDKYRKYQQYAAKAGKTMGGAGNRPMCVVPPYFRTTVVHSTGWHATNLRFVESAKTMAGDLPVFPLILADSQVLGRDGKRIADDYLAVGADGFLLWSDGFSSNQDAPALRVVFDAVEELSKGGKPVILMYADAFSLVLHYAGLAGFVCGICYGERKVSTDDVDVEASIPPRYYIRRLKKKVVIETEAKRIQIDQYPDLVCNCDICQHKPDPATQDDTESREHFMLVRAEEIAALRGGLSQEDFAAELADAYRRHCNDLLLRPIGHLQNWAAVLSVGVP